MMASESQRRATEAFDRLMRDPGAMVRMSLYTNVPGEDDMPEDRPVDTRSNFERMDSALCPDKPQLAGARHAQEVAELALAAVELAGRAQRLAMELVAEDAAANYRPITSDLPAMPTEGAKYHNANGQEWRYFGGRDGRRGRWEMVIENPSKPTPATEWTPAQIRYRILQDNAMSLWEALKADEATGWRRGNAATLTRIVNTLDANAAETTPDEARYR